MRILSPALGSLVLLASPAAAATLEEVNNRLFLQVTINGQPTTALLDSAAEMTIVDDDFAKRLGLIETGSAVAHGSGAEKMEARFADDVRVQAVGADFKTKVGILDLGEVSKRLLGRPVDMLLGRDLFEQGRFRIDIADGTIFPVTDLPQGGVRLPLSYHRGVPAVAASAEGSGPVTAVFDLGNGREVLVGRAYAEKLGLTAPGRIVDKRSGGGLGGAVDFDIVVLRTLKVGGRDFRDVRAAIDKGESASDLNLGTSILRHFVITTDFTNGAIWLEPRE